MLRFRLVTYICQILPPLSVNLLTFGCSYDARTSSPYKCFLCSRREEPSLLSIDGTRCTALQERRWIWRQFYKSPFHQKGERVLFTKLYADHNGFQLSRDLFYFFLFSFRSSTVKLPSANFFSYNDSGIMMRVLV